MNPYWAALIFLLLFQVVAAIARRGEEPRRGQALLLIIGFLPAVFLGLFLCLAILFERNTPTEASEAILLAGVVGLIAVGIASALLLSRWETGRPLVLASTLLTYCLVSLFLPVPDAVSPTPLAAAFLVLLGGIFLPHAVLRVWHGSLRGKASGLTLAAILLGPSLVFAPFGAYLMLDSDVAQPYQEAFRLEVRPDNTTVGYALTLPVAPLNDTLDARRFNEILLRNARLESGEARLEATADGRLRLIAQGAVVVVSAVEYYGRAPAENIHGRSWRESPIEVQGLQPVTLFVEWSLRNVGPSRPGCMFDHAEARFSASGGAQLAEPGTPLAFTCG